MTNAEDDKAETTPKKGGEKVQIRKEGQKKRHVGGNEGGERRPRLRQEGWWREIVGRRPPRISWPCGDEASLAVTPKR